MTTELNGFDFEGLVKETERREEEKPPTHQCCDCGHWCRPHKTFSDGEVWCLRCWFANTG